MHCRRSLRKAPWILSLALFAFLTSCAPSTEFYRGVESNISGGNYLAALDEVRANQRSYGDKATVLYKLDMGLLYHYAGQPDSSTRWLLAAEREIEDLYTKSISLAAISMVLNDNVLPYDGEDFEKVLVNVFLALNFAEKGEPDEALVEARKVDLKLREFAKQYEGKNRYQEDAFIRYIMGALYESQGEINDAFISYRKSWEAYATYAREYATPAPSFLLDDLVRTATLMSFDEEAAAYRAKGGRPYERRAMPFGSILVVAYAGKGPIKEEYRPTVNVADANGVIHTFQTALPRFVPRHQSGRTYEVSILGPGATIPVKTRTEVAENVTAIASRTLEDRMTMIYLKTGGRALLKFLAAEKAKAELSKDSDDKVKNILGSIAIDLTVGATERADVRTWRTLPAEFQIARVQLPPGQYSLHAGSSDGRYVLPEETVTVKKGRTTFVIIDDVR
ncbi:MAG: hypothetical protein AB1428_04935 [Bacteroidota bacterium]